MVCRCYRSNDRFVPCISLSVQLATLHLLRVGRQGGREDREFLSGIPQGVVVLARLGP